MQADLKIGGSFDCVYVMNAKPYLEDLAKASHDIAIDMSETKYVDCSGIAALALLYKRLKPRGLKVQVVGLNGQPLQLFVNLHLAELFVKESLSS
jgi:anti-anti-sigma factor